MKFLADGPSIPDELLVASDEGRVLFFCGAGVSRAGANLPGFLGLAESVLKELRVLDDSPARKLVQLAGKLEPIAGIGSILAADRIFGLLEREFSQRDIEAAVGHVLNPREPIDPSPHRVLLALSSDANGKPRAVTTNFDLLFEKTRPRLKRWSPNELPDLRRTASFEGIVHLHGMFDEKYERAVGGNLVLSSAEFGRAYLAEGWATDFIRTAIDKYLIVFVGYAADDPPVQYLLEALNRSVGEPPPGLYAFQAGSESEAKALWSSKGVHAIAYSSKDHHAVLWQTLALWAERKRDPKRWREVVIREARHGPENLKPYERGQVVHLASTPEGALALAEAKTPLPATWLCAFDPQIRYQPPGPRRPLQADDPEFEPFLAYGLDSDPEPDKKREHQALPKRNVPDGAIDVLAHVNIDSAEQQKHASLRGTRLGHSTALPPRLVSLAAWLARVCDQSAALWWAAGQNGLHPLVERRIKLSVDQRTSKVSPEIRQAWNYLFEAWSGLGDDDGAYDLKKRLARDGWTPPLLRRFQRVTRAYITAKRPFWVGPAPPDPTKRFRLRDVVNLEMHYPGPETQFDIPDAEVAKALRLLRRNLEHAIALDHQVNPTSLAFIAPIEPDPDLVGESSDRDFGINPSVATFVALYRRLLALDRAAALREFRTWPRDDDVVFGRLCIWAAGLSDFLDDAIAAETLLDATENQFWGSRHQRDLLLTLSRRWNALPAEARNKLEQRLRAGPSLNYGTPKQRRIWHAVAILDRLYWLKDKGCALSFNIEKVAARFKTAVPDWSPAEAKKAAASHEGRGGMVHMDRTFGALAELPPAQMVVQAMAERSREFSELREHDPFGGLSEARPARVLAGLRQLTAGGTDTALAWTEFLHSIARHKDKPRLTGLIARRIISLPNATLIAIIAPAAYWFENARQILVQSSTAVLYCLADRLSALIQDNPDAAEREKPKPSVEREWVNSAYSAPAGHVMSALLADPNMNKRKSGEGLPEAWCERAEALRTLPNDHGRFALVYLARFLDFFYARDSKWTESVILSALAGAQPDREAMLAGFFTNSVIGTESLYAQMKPLFVTLATAGDPLGRRYERELTGQFVGGWLAHRKEPTGWLSDDEFREVLVHATDGLRAQTLWYVDQFAYDDKLALLTNVWPLQLAARSPVVTSRLCQIAFHDAEHFPELVDAILPLAGPLEMTDFTVPAFHEKEPKVFIEHPEHVLKLLWNILPTDAARWPWGTGTALLRLADLAPQLKNDDRLIELQRRAKAHASST